MRKEKLIFGLIAGTRGFVSPEPARSGREHLIAQLEKLRHKHVILPPDAAPSSAVENLDDAGKCADLFNHH